MEVFMRTRSVLFGLATCFALLSPACATSRVITPQNIEEYFARYASAGRSNVEIHFSTKGGDDTTTITKGDDGTFSAFISFYEVPIATDDPELSEMLKRWVFIHEHSHALVAPYIDLPPTAPKQSAEWTAFMLVKLAGESSADARVIIEMWRKDGEERARRLAKTLVEFRSTRSVLSHRTEEAMKKTLTVLEAGHPDLATDEGAFNLSLSIGKESAIATIRNIYRQHLTQERVDELVNSPQVSDATRLIESGFAKAEDAFSRGKFTNRAGTMRFAREENVSTAEDYHFFLGENGTIMREAVYGAEGARGKREMEELMRSDGTPLQFFAVETVKKLHRITKDQLGDTIIVYTRFAKLFGNSPERLAKTYGVMAMTIAKADPRMGLGEIYTEVNRNLMFEVGYPKE